MELHVGSVSDPHYFFADPDSDPGKKLKCGSGPRSYNNVRDLLEL